MAKKLKILILAKPFGKIYPKHKAKYDFLKAIEEFAHVQYWSKNGDIRDIIRKIGYIPDFIFQYDIAYGYSYTPKVWGLDQVSIPKGAYVNDAQWSPQNRMRYFEQNRIDIIFSTYKYGFLSRYPKFKSKFRWLPYSINPQVTKDWGANKEIDFLFMGQIDPRYPFRAAVVDRMKGISGFKYYSHRNNAPLPKNMKLNEEFSKEINRSKIFFTCGSIFKYAVLKFFEAPGSRTLLLAEPNQDILDLGFKDGENFVACNQDNFYEKAMYYLENEEERERITQNGYEFIHTFHTNRVRAQQFVKNIQDFLKTLPAKKKKMLPQPKHEANARNWALNQKRQTNARHWTINQKRQTENSNWNVYRIDKKQN
ncbi:glycosyltransferase [Ammoniphilus sp. 3BR4]|uniref:glycosyltransferase family protein n=1 Tax=Ammoniphilus sp. 3BR4 TaxID=3158265 RepID=UPI0034653B63